MKNYDIIIIGGGSAGIAAATAAYKEGSRSILLLEREKELGGILQQCIHNGFGLHMFHEELAGPSYAQRWIDELNGLGIEYRLNTMVIHLSSEKIVEYVNPIEGYTRVKGKAVILAMGCRERTRGAIGIPGYRPSGIWTAGTAQRYLNLDGYKVGSKVFILGSGDIGLIMARRMSLEGAKVLGVAEIMPYSNGLSRNIKQCLDDFEIPLYLNHTVVDIKGKDRLSSVIIAGVDENRRPLQGTEKEFEADTLLLSVGLIPENSLSKEAGILLDPVTKGPIVNEMLETNIEGIFACGNVLHVHDLVDFVSKEGIKAGVEASNYIKKKGRTGFLVETKAGEGLSYILPQKLHIGMMPEQQEFMFRVKKNYRNARVNIYEDGRLIKSIKKSHLAPAEMEKAVLSKYELPDTSADLLFEISEAV